MRATTLLHALLLLLASQALAREQIHLPQTSLLLIMMEDLRPELSIYGKEWMNTPNFERLAKRGIVFDLALSQATSSNPSRTSMLTGLRPDTLGGYTTQTQDFGHKVLPEHLVNAGYNTAAFGKIRHFEQWDKHVWSHEQYDGDWYAYQNKEYTNLNSTVVSDKTRKDWEFRDHMFASKAIANLKEFASQDAYFMTAVGFKLPHPVLHVPKTYYDMYEDQKDSLGRQADIERTFPRSAPLVSYHCGCDDEAFKTMSGETLPFGNVSSPVSLAVHRELTQGYAAAVSFVDAQLGRILDAVEELHLWKNLTIVVTSDHGALLGEKGIWGRKSLFDESARVPLIIAHPESPYKGSHVFEPVELVDIFPTVLDLVSSPHVRGKPIMHAHSRAVAHDQAQGQGHRKREGHHRGHHDELGGKSLASLVVGSKYRLSLHRGRSAHGAGGGIASHRHAAQRQGGLHSGFALTQALRCADWGSSKDPVYYMGSPSTEEAQAAATMWKECDLSEQKTASNGTSASGLGRSSLMGYSIRTIDFRYTVWLYFDLQSLLVEWERGMYAEELYDHREEGLGDLGKFELANMLAPHAPLATQEAYRETAQEQRTMLVHFLQRQVAFKKHLIPQWHETADAQKYEEGKRGFNEKYLKVRRAHSSSGNDSAATTDASGGGKKRLTRREEKKLKDFIRDFATEGAVASDAAGGVVERSNPE